MTFIPFMCRWLLMCTLLASHIIEALTRDDRLMFVGLRVKAVMPALKKVLTFVVVTW